MATKSLTATIFGVDQASPAFDKVGKSATRMAGTTEQAGSRMGKAISKGAKMAAAALAAVGFTKFVKQTISEASDLEQNMGAAEAVFGSAVSQIKIFGKTSASTVGVAKQDYYQLAAVFGSQLKNMGVAADQLAPQTNRLVSLGADLAAVYGGKASDAVEAISSLMRGERDPIERYGVSIKQASINAYELAHGLDTSTAEAKTASDLQATLALLFEQTADAQGQFADQTDTLAESQQIATAKFREAQAEIGQKLLPIITDLTNFAADDLVPILGVVADGLGEVIDFVDGLPGPVKAALTAFAGWKILQSTGVFTKLAAQVKIFKQEMAFASYQTDASGKALGRVSIAAKAAKSRVGSFAKAIGPGAALAAGVFVISQIVDGFTHVNQSVLAVKDSASDLAQQLADNNGLWDESIQKAYENTIVNSDVFKALINDGADYGKTLAALTGQTDLYGKATDGTSVAMDEALMHIGALNVDQLEALDSMLHLKDATEQQASSLQKYRDLQEQTSASTADATEWNGKLAGAYAQLQDAQMASERASEDSEAATVALAAAAEENTDSWARMGGTISVTAESVADSRSEVDKMSDALKIFKTKTSEADTRLQYFTMQIDKLAGRNINLEDATRLLNDQVRSVRQTFEDATKATKGHVESLITADGAIDTTTEAGSKLYGALGDYRNAFDAATSAAYDNARANGKSVPEALKAGRDAADDAREQFLKQADALGINADKAKKMADHMGILAGKKIPDKAFTIKVDDEATSELHKIKQSIDDIPSWKPVHVDVQGGPGYTVYHHLATGGPAVGGRSYVVGEHGREILTMAPGSSGHVTNHQGTTRLLSGLTMGHRASGGPVGEPSAWLSGAGSGPVQVTVQVPGGFVGSAQQLADVLTPAFAEAVDRAKRSGRIPREAFA